MKLSQEVWNMKDENFGPLLKYIKNENVTDLNFNGKDLWIEDLYLGRYSVICPIIHIESSDSCSN